MGSGNAIGRIMLRVAIAAVWVSTVRAGESMVQTQHVQVASRIQKELSRLGIGDKYVLDTKSSFDNNQDLYWIWLRQKAPPYRPDGDKLGIVSRDLVKACVQQALMPPRPCT
jgi:hypothetical protein